MVLALAGLSTTTTFIMTLGWKADRPGGERRESGGLYGGLSTRPPINSIAWAPSRRLLRPLRDSAKAIFTTAVTADGYDRQSDRHRGPRLADPTDQGRDVECRTGGDRRSAEAG